MPIYHTLGTIPNKRHVVSRQANGNLYQEELVGTQGFAGMSSLVYHLYPPTRVKQKDKAYSVAPKVVLENTLDCMSFQGFDVQPEKDYLKSRKTLFVNAGMHIGLAAPMESTPYFFKNADADEMIFVHEGSG
ncbi:MAG TPA: homogentisate 1,2-dioxygenase, partial [Chitinophagaceae bacterium]|nr:homogentisate 1,2-dioxygenase [Chitinophagaceae bacterium]